MNAEEFVGLITNLKPTRKEIRKYSDEMLDILMQEFEIKKNQILVVTIQ